jgi:3-phosphoshikimate 1-carboxyvinyltransferase
MQGLCRDHCQLTNISDCDDTRVMLKAFDNDATKYSFADDGARIVDIGAAGTSMRFLTAFFASQEGKEVVMTGSERMKQRPIALLVDALRTLGAQIDYVGAEGFPPLRIHGRKLEGGTLTIDGSVSSQYISALLMIAPTMSKGLALTLSGHITSVPYIEMTLGMLRQFGIASTWDHLTQVISIAPQPYKAQQYHVESDWSAASYWYEIASLAARNLSNTITLEGLHAQSLQGDAAIANYFEALGIRTNYRDDAVTLESSDIPTEARPPLEMDLTSQPDLAQTLIVTCCALNVPFRITGLHTLRIKETDRVAALETELKKLGYVVTDQELNGSVEMQWDGTRCEAKADPVIATYKDHRMAMAFAPMSLVLPSHSILIDDPGVVSKSYPYYWEDLRKAGFSIKELSF